jgi:hypothetical protein
MKNLPPNTGIIQSFRVNSRRYVHSICTKTDVVFLTNDAGEVLATYSQNAAMIGPDGEDIGRFKLGARYCWYFDLENGKIFDGFGNDLLNAEVEISKLFIEGKLK